MKIIKIRKERYKHVQMPCSNMLPHQINVVARILLSYFGEKIHTGAANAMFARKRNETGQLVSTSLT